MFTTSALGGFFKDIQVNTKNLTEAESRKLLVSTAVSERDRVINENRAQSGFPPAYRQIVDGKEGAALEMVRPDGVIIFAWQYAVEIADDILGALVNRSPYYKGEYIKGIIVLLDGQEGLLKDVTEATKRIQIVASVDYARRLEVGMRDDHTPFVLQVAPHIVEETAIVSRKLYGKLASITYGYIDLNDAWRLGPMGRRNRSRRPGGGWYVRPTPRRDTHVRYPAITIEPRVV